ncbi:MAG: hypothetical protein L3J24_13840 [Xanthomonadales bacterium]|nr:hypothetical protein [Xanthomonadales bacterium]
MKAFGFLMLVIVSIMLLSACYNTEGKTKSSKIAGFESYSNKTINASVLTPIGWDGQVSVGGEYVLTFPAADKVQIIISSADITRLMGNASSVSLEGYVKFRASQVTEKTIGPDFNLRKSKSKLAGLDAYEFLYSVSG